MAYRRWMLWLVGVPALALLLIVLAAVLTTGGRSSDPLLSIPRTTMFSEALPDPCAVIPADRMERLLGRSEPGVAESETSCRFGEEEAGTTSIRVQVFASPAGLADLAGARDLAVGAFGAASVVDIPDIGKGAFSVASPEATLVRFLGMGHQTVIGVAGASAGEAELALVLDLARAAASTS